METGRVKKYLQHTFNQGFRILETISLYGGLSIEEINFDFTIEIYSQSIERNINKWLSLNLNSKFGEGIRILA